MPVFLDTTGQPTLGIGLCDRCRRKFPLMLLFQDPNSPGLYVCEDDRDQYDPYRLPARQAERINLPYVRPDESVEQFGEDPGYALYAEYFMTEDTGYHMVYEDGIFMETEIGL